MNEIEELRAKIKELEAKVTEVDDVQKVIKLQRMYGFYLDNGMFEEIADLFSDNAESVEISDGGVYLGKKGIEKCYLVLHKAVVPMGGKPPMFTTMPLQGVVDIEPDGKKAKGRWNVFMMLTAPEKEGGEWRAIWGHGVYENEYIKEDGKWRIFKLRFHLKVRTPYEDGWVKTPVAFTMKHSGVQPDAPTTVYEPYPSQYIVPFHYKHPITGKDVNR